MVKAATAEKSFTFCRRVYRLVSERACFSICVFEEPPPQNFYNSPELWRLLSCRYIKRPLSVWENSSIISHYAAARLKHQAAKKRHTRRFLCDAKALISKINTEVVHESSCELTQAIFPFPPPAGLSPYFGSLTVTACGNAHCNKAISCMQMSCLHVPAPVIVT